MKSIIIKATVVFLLISLGSGKLLAQSPKGEFYVRGVVVDASASEAMEYVNVVLYSMRDSSIVTGTITDAKGKFNIKVNRPGRFYLTADFIGFEKSIVNNVLLNPSNETFNIGTIAIRPATVDINEVEVIGEKPFVSYKLDRKVVEVSRNPSAQGGTAVDALENVPSINIDIEGNVEIRGSTDFTVLIDGRQSALTGTDALNQIPASAISQIEIITNPSAKYDPDGTAGILNIITKKGKLKGHSMVANASIGNSPRSSADLTYSYRHQKFSFTGNLGFRDTKMDFNHSDRRETTETDTITGEPGLSYIITDRDGLMKRGNYFFKSGFDYYLSESNSFSIGGSYNNFLYGRNFDSRIYTQSVYDEDNYELSSSQYEVNPESWQINIGDKQIFSNEKDHYIQLDVMHQWRNKETIDVLSKHQANSDWEEGILLQPEEQAKTYEDANRTRVEFNYSVPFLENHLFETGYTFRSDAYTQDYFRFTRNTSDENWVPNSEFNDVAKFSRYINAGWFVIKGIAFADIQYSAGLRFEHTDRNIATEKDNWDYNYNYMGWYPSLSLAKEWTSGHTLQGSYSKRINRPRDHHLNPFPGLSDGYVVWQPNPELEPEYASSFEVNYQKKWGQTFVALETFYRKTINEMDRVNIVSGDTLIRTMINLGSESDAGVELAGNVKIASWWSFNPTAVIAYNYVEGTILNNNKEASGTIFRGSLNNNFFLPTKTRIQLMSFYRGPQNEVDGTREQTYWVSAAIRQDFFDRKLSATIRVDDIFGTRKREGYTYAENTTVYSKGQRKSPMVVLSLSYKINPSNDKNRNGRENGNGGNEIDMDF